jgi:hypothetical protein
MLVQVGQYVSLAHHRVPHVNGLLDQDLIHHLRVVLEAKTEQVVGRHHHDPEGTARLRREVAQIERYDRIGLAGHGGGKDVLILRMVVDQPELVAA